MGTTSTTDRRRQHGEPDCVANSEQICTELECGGLFLTESTRRCIPSIGRTSFVCVPRHVRSAPVVQHLVSLRVQHCILIGVVFSRKVDGAHWFHSFPSAAFKCFADRLCVGCHTCSHTQVDVQHHGSPVACLLYGCYHTSLSVQSSRCVWRRVPHFHPVCIECAL